MTGQEPGTVLTREQIARTIFEVHGDWEAAHRFRQARIDAGLGNRSRQIELAYRQADALLAAGDAPVSSVAPSPDREALGVEDFREGYALFRGRPDEARAEFDQWLSRLMETARTGVIDWFEARWEATQYDAPMFTEARERFAAALAVAPPHPTPAEVIDWIESDNGFNHPNRAARARERFAVGAEKR